MSRDSDDLRDMWADGWITRVMLVIWFTSMAMWFACIGWLVCSIVRHVS